MNVFAQPTDINLRLCSLMSAVLHRSLRPDFVYTTERKADRLRKHRSITIKATDHCNISLIFVGPTLLTNSVSRRVPKFSRNCVFDISTIPFDTSKEASTIGYLVTSLQSIQRSVHFSFQAQRRVVLVSIGSGLDLITYLLRNESLSGIIGFLVINPPNHDLAAFLPDYLPALVTLSWSNSGLSNMYRRDYLAHPNVILVEHDSGSHGYEFEQFTGKSQKGKASPMFHTYWLWLARLVAEYSESIAYLDECDKAPKGFHATPQTISCSHPPSRL